MSNSSAPSRPLSLAHGSAPTKKTFSRRNTSASERCVIFTEAQLKQFDCLSEALDAHAYLKNEQEKDDTEGFQLEEGTLVRERCAVDFSTLCKIVNLATQCTETSLHISTYFVDFPNSAAALQFTKDLTILRENLNSLTCNSSDLWEQWVNTKDVDQQETYTTTTTTNSTPSVDHGSAASLSVNLSQPPAGVTTTSLSEDIDIVDEGDEVEEEKPEQKKEDDDTEEYIFVTLDVDPKLSHTNDKDEVTIVSGNREEIPSFDNAIQGSYHQTNFKVLINADLNVDTTNLSKKDNLRVNVEYSTPTSSHSEPLELRETADMSNSCSEDIDETDTTKSLTSRPQQKDACYEDIDGVVHMEVFNEKYDLDTLTIEDPHEVITNTGANNCNYTYNKNERKDTTTTHNHTERKPDASQTTNGGNIRLNSESGTSVANQEKKREDGDDIRIHQKSRHRSASRSPRQSEPLSNPRDRDIRTNDTKRDSVTLNQRESAFHSNKTETSKITHIDTYRPSYSCRNERLNSHNRSRSPQRDLRYNFRPRSRSPQPDRHIDRDRNGGSFNNHSSTFRSSNRDHGRPGYQGIYYDPTRDSKMSPTTSVDTYFVPNSNSAQLPPRTITSTTTTPGAQSQDRMPLARLLQDLSHNNNNNTPHSNAPPPSQLELQQQQQAHQQLQFQLQQLLGGQQIHLQPQYNHHYHHQHQQQQQQDILSLSPPLSTSAQYTTPVMNNLAALAQVFQFQGQEYQLIPVNPNNNKRSRDMEDNDVEEKDRESKRSKK